MVITHYEKNGYIQSFLECHVVDRCGSLTNTGLYLYVSQVWVHPSIEGDQEIACFIVELDQDKRIETVEYIYWQRAKTDTPKRLSRLFKRSTCVKLSSKILRSRGCSLFV